MFYDQKDSGMRIAELASLIFILVHYIKICIYT